MEKKLYTAPVLEQIRVFSDSLIMEGWSAEVVIGGDDGPFEPHAKQNTFDDDFDFLDDEEIEAGWSFNVWED